jgi:adenylate kinase
LNRQLPVLVLFGCPGAGKGSLARFLVERHGFAHLSTGAAMRAWADGPSMEQHALRDDMSRGIYASDALAARIVGETIAKLPACTPAVILDGYPRNPAQFDAWRSTGGSGTGLVLELPESVAVARITERGTCPRDGMGFPGVGLPCLVCGTLTVRRQDDGEVETVRRRFATYRETVLPVLDAWRRAGLPLRVVDADRPFESLVTLADTVARSIGTSTGQSVGKVLAGV